MTRNFILTEEMEQKWEPVLEHKKMPKIEDSYRRDTTVRLLENTEQFLKETTNTTHNQDIYDPIIMNMVRRTAPNNIGYDICGLQPLNGPTGLVFAMRAIYGAASQGPYGRPGDARDGWQTGSGLDSNGRTRAEDWAYDGQAPNEAFYNEADTTHSGTGTQSANDGTAYDDDFASYDYGRGMDTLTGETMGRGLSGDAEWNEMSISIEKQNVEAKTRGLKAEYTQELAQDMRSVHGMDAEAELANVLSTEIVAEVNRELVNRIRYTAKIAPGEKLYENGSLVTDSQGDAVTGQAGLWNLDKNSDGRWSQEKYASLLMKINKEANAIAKDTRRGRGNILIVSSDVASMLDLAGKMTYAPGINNNFTPDDTGPTFIGTLQGRYRVFIDPYISYDEVIIGYKGANPMDAGVFYCPYVPLYMVKAMGENTFQPKIAFKTRFGFISNPMTSIERNNNLFYRKLKVENI